MTEHSPAVLRVRQTDIFKFNGGRVSLRLSEGPDLHLSHAPLALSSVSQFKVRSVVPVTLLASGLCRFHCAGCSEVVGTCADHVADDRRG